MNWSSTKSREPNGSVFQALGTVEQKASGHKKQKKKDHLIEASDKPKLVHQYATDGRFAATIAVLPRGLRAMAATHCLDISLTIDSMTWHFGNFGEPGLVAETETGLRELGLHELALCFAEAKELMLPLLAQRTEADGDSDEILERAGLERRAEELNLRALTAYGVGSGESVIYEAWIKHARQYPERVFGP